MAEVYEIQVHEMKGKTSEFLYDLLLIDAENSYDQWVQNTSRFTKKIGDGAGQWFRASSYNEVQLCDSAGGSIFGAMQYESWPLKNLDKGKFKLYGPGEEKDLNFLVFRVR